MLNTDRRVVNLTTYLKPMKHPVLIELLRHWEALRGADTVPSRSALDPRQIENVLEHAFILEESGDGQPRFRIAGMTISELMGMEVRGMPAVSLIAEQDRPRFAGIMQRLLQKPEIVELSLVTEGRGPVPMLMLPLRNDKGAVNRILGCLVATPPVATPCRLTIQSAKSTRIVASAAALPQNLAEDVHGFAEPVHRFAAAPRKETPPYLRLIASDD